MSQSVDAGLTEVGVAVARASRPTRNQGEGRLGSAPADSSWPSALQRRVVAGDVIGILAAAAAVHIYCVGAKVFHPAHAVDHLLYIALSIVVACGWLVGLGMSGAWNSEIIGAGLPAYGRVVKSSLATFGLFAAIALLGGIDVSRIYLAMILPLGICLLLCAHARWHAGLVRHRSAGMMMHATLVVGGPEAGRELALDLAATPASGYRIVGLCVPDVDGDVRRTNGLITNPVREVIETAKDLHATTIIVANDHHLTPEMIRRLKWQADSASLNLLVAPMLTDIPQPQIATEPVPSLQLVYLGRGRRTWVSACMKVVTDYVCAVIALILLSPVMVLAAVAIKAEDRGPVFFRQIRSGHDQRPFKIWKFRTMSEPAAGSGNTAIDPAPVFSKRHPTGRVTRVGAVLRKTSVDELPQLFNVLCGQMSIVGPRPLVPEEGREIDGFVERRTMLKPGLTGLWQVSGRSELTGERAARMDLVYVDNWSLAHDLRILVKTVRVVLSCRGAR